MLQLSRHQTTDIALLLMRSLIGALFIYHGCQKLFGLFGGYGIEGTAGWMESMGIPLPKVSTVLAGSAELLGGLAFLTGFALRLLSIPLAFTMLVAVFITRAQFDAGAGGMEFPLVLGVFVVGLGLLGPGRFALAARREDPAR
jgi:putative oxidoreductase